jgi:hypothetical protein
MGRIRRTTIGAQFSPRRIDMLSSPAWRALSLSAHRVIDRISIELMHHGGADNGRLPVTYDDFEKYGIHRHSIAPAIREAAALGFVEITKEGRAGNAEWRRPHLFRLTFARSDNERSDGTHEWKNISKEDAPLIAVEARKGVQAKTKSQWRKMPVLGGGNRTENPKSIVRKPPLQGIVQKPPLLSISREGVKNEAPGSERIAEQIQNGPIHASPALLASAIVRRATVRRGK